jgi:hypothetical protein
MVELVVDGSLEIKKDTLSNGRKDRFATIFYLKKGPKFHLKRHNEYQILVLNSFKGSNEFITLEDILLKIDQKVKGTLSTFGFKFVKPHIKKIGWHASTVFSHNYLSKNGKKAQKTLNKEHKEAEKQLSKRLSEHSEHAITLINDLDKYLLLIDNITYEDTLTIKNLIQKKHPSLKTNLELQKIDLPLLYEFKLSCQNFSPKNRRPEKNVA